MREMMKYYKDENNMIYAYDAYGSQDSFIKEGLVLITRSEAMAILNPPPTHEELSAAAELKKTNLRIQADSEIDWRQDAVDAGIATGEETAALAEWKKYRVLLMRVDTAKPLWPTPPGGQAS